MTIKTTVYAALSAVLANSHAIQLPDRPTWPAIVFEVDSKSEPNWCKGGGYDQHVVTVISMSTDLEEVEALRPQVLAAMEALAGYMADEEHGDAEYEADADVYAYFQNFRIRTRRT